MRNNCVVALITRTIEGKIKVKAVKVGSRIPFIKRIIRMEDVEKTVSHLTNLIIVKKK